MADSQTVLHIIKLINIDMTKYIMIKIHYADYKSNLIVQFRSIANKNIRRRHCNPAKMKTIP